MVNALRELDISFGRYVSGTVVSGHKIPSYKDVRTKEDPLRLTQRALVDPIMSYLGYRTVFSGDVFNGKIPGISIATVSMNSLLSSASSRVLCAMNADSAPKGIATDGFRWALAIQVNGINRICMVSDLRPYYIEVLDRDRFRVAEREDDRSLNNFIKAFDHRQNRIL